MENEKSALGLDANITALLGYIIGIVALVLIFIEKENKFVRFHALQSVLYSVGMVILIIVVAIVGGGLAFALAYASPTLGSLVGILVFIVYMLLILAIIGGHLFGAYKAYNKEMFKFPVVGNFAEKWV